MPGPEPYLSGQFKPPAPACSVRFTSNGRSKAAIALLDTGADSTIITPAVAAALSLQKVTDGDIEGVTGEEKNCPGYHVDIEFLGMPFPNHLVFEVSKADCVLIGRDILNRYKATMDGRAQEFYIE